MVHKNNRSKQIRPVHMSLDQLKKLLLRREMGVQYVKFLISQMEAK